MEHPTFDLPSEAVTLTDFARDVARRRAAAGSLSIPRNDGERRTASKRDLLAALNATGTRW